MPDATPSVSVARDVTAVVLIAGEPEAMRRRCLAAVQAQTRQPARTIEIRGHQPFHAAFAAGLARVNTALLWQVDVDMVPDPDCLAVLRAAIRPGTAMALGYLQDPMLGPIHGIKLFDTDALRAHPLPAGLTAETRQVHAMVADGQELVQAQRIEPGHGHPAEVLGRHEPDYDDEGVVCNRFRRLGEKVRERGGFRNIGAYLDRLARHGHPNRHLALLAFADGLIGGPHGDGHDPNGDCAVAELYSELRETGLEQRFPFVRRRVDPDGT